VWLLVDYLECTGRNVQENLEGEELNGTGHLVNVDDVNLLDGNMNTLSGTQELC
jgi:hypothetical protein